MDPEQQQQQQPKQSRRVRRCETCRSRKVKCTGSNTPCNNCRRLGLACAFRGSSIGPATETQLVSPTGHLTEAGTVRQRTTTACQECRLHKAKCSGRRPQCQRCERRQLTCVYSRSTASDRESQDQDVSETISATVSAPLDLTTHTTTFLRRDVLAQHIDAYFTHIYPLPGYDFLHRPSLMEDLHHDRIPPPLAMALCAAVSMYMSSQSSRDSRRLEMRWARDVDEYLFRNLGTMRQGLLDLQVVALSMFHQFSYRQFGRVWVMMGMAARLALGIQLNDDRFTTPPTNRECSRRVAWCLFLRDKLASGGIDEFEVLPDRWMRIPLPLDEHDFLHGRSDVQPGTLAQYTEHDNAIIPGMQGIRGWIILIINMHHPILRVSKAVISLSKVTSPPPSSDAIEAALAPLVALESRLASLYAALPSHLALSDRSIFIHSTSPELPAFVFLHSWALILHLNLYRVCLPGSSRESASPEFLSRISSPLFDVASWRTKAVSHAHSLALFWRRLLELQGSGALRPTTPLLAPESVVTVHQCTKILIVARRFGLFAASSGSPDTPTAEDVEALCWSNIAFLGQLAGKAPIAAVVYRDVRAMVEDEARRRDQSHDQEQPQPPPVSSELQKDKILSRYHILAMAVTDEQDEHQQRQTRVGNNEGRIPEEYPARIAEPLDAGLSTSGLNPTGQMPTQSAAATPIFAHMANGHGAASSGYDSVNLDTSLPGSIFPDYSVEPSQSDMQGELDWFLGQALMEDVTSEPWLSLPDTRPM